MHILAVQVKSQGTLCCLLIGDLEVTSRPGCKWGEGSDLLLGKSRDDAEVLLLSVAVPTDQIEGKKNPQKTTITSGK